MARDIINQLEGTGDRLLIQATQNGEMLLAQLGNHLRVGTENLGLAMGDQREKTFGQLSPPLQNAVTALNT